MRSRSAAARRAGGARLAAGAALLGLALLVERPVTGPAPAAASPGRAAPTIELADQPAWVKGEADFAVDVRISGAPPGATVDMVVHDRLQSRGQFRDTLDGDLGGTEHRVDAQPVASLPSVAPGTVRVGFAPGGASGLRSSGVYPVEVRVLAGGEPVATLDTYLSFLREPTPEQPPLEVATIIDLAAPTALQPDGSTDVSTGSIALVRQRLEAVSEAGGAVVTLAPGPETVEGLVAASGGESAEVDELRRLSTGRQVLARPFVDVDLAALHDAGLLGEANVHAAEGADIVRSRLGVEPVPGVWLPGTTWGDESAHQAVALGIDRAVVPLTAVGDGSTDQAVPPGPVWLGDDNGPLAMVSDPGLAEHLLSDEGVIAAHRFLAELTILWLEAPALPRGVVVRLPPTGAVDPTVVGTALARLADGQAVRSVPLTDVFADVPAPTDGPTTLSLAPHRSSDLDDVAPEIRSLRRRVSGVGPLLDDPGAGAAIEHSLLLGTAADTAERDRARYVDHAAAGLRQVSGAVTLPEAFRITLTSRSSTVPVNLTNNLDRNVSVRVELDSDQLEFPEGAAFDQVLPPGTTRVEVPVRTRTSGAFTLEVRVLSPDSSIVLDTSTFDIRSTAISGVGLVLSVGAGLFLAIWWARNWRTSRRTRRIEVQPPATGSGGDGSPDRGGASRRAVTGHPTPWATAPARPAPAGRPDHGADAGLRRTPPAGTAGSRPDARDDAERAPRAPAAPRAGFLGPSRPAPPGAPRADAGDRPGPAASGFPQPRSTFPGRPAPAGGRPTPAGPGAPAERGAGVPAPEAPEHEPDDYRPAHMARPRAGRRLPVSWWGGHSGRARR